MTPEIVPADFPGLAGLCWNRNTAHPIQRDIAWALYRNNWRFIWRAVADAWRGAPEDVAMA